MSARPEGLRSDRPSWQFDSVDNGEQATVGLGGWTPSALVVNEVSRVRPTVTPPACNSLLGEPCRLLPAVAPVVTTQPISQSVAPGGTVAFTAAASATPTPTVQWQASVVGGSTWINAVGVPTTTISGMPTAFENGWKLRGVFTNSAGSTTTNTATLTVT